MSMFGRFNLGPLVTAPAIWGKLPCHSDLVRSGMRLGESEAWTHWLSMQGAVVRSGGPMPPTSMLPTAFVLSPGSLSPAIHRFTVGVIVPSMDHIGHRHVLIVYQLARARWVNRHFTLHESHPFDWFFWLGRALSRHLALAEAADIWMLARAVEELWKAFVSFCAGHHGLCRVQCASSPSMEKMEALLERLFEVPAMSDRAACTKGTRQLPWSDWPQCLLHRSMSMPAAFWQQGADGGFVNAALQLDTLWNRVPA